MTGQHTELYRGCGFNETDQKHRAGPSQAEPSRVGSGRAVSARFGSAGCALVAKVAISYEVARRSGQSGLTGRVLTARTRPDALTWPIGCPRAATPGQTAAVAMVGRGMALMAEWRPAGQRRRVLGQSLTERRAEQLVLAKFMSFDLHPHG